MVLTKIFGAKEEEISGTWKKFHIGELDDLPSGDQIKEVGISETWCAVKKKERYS